MIPSGFRPPDEPCEQTTGRIYPYIGAGSILVKTVVWIYLTNMKGNKMSIGATIKKLRIRNGESLQQVADAVGASKPHIWELESNRTANPSLDLLKRLAQHFKVPISYLLEERADADALIFGREVAGLTEADKKLLLDMAERISGQKSDG